MPQLSVIIPTFNEADNIRRLLGQLVDQQDIELEVIVVDGGSTDDTLGVAEAFNVACLVSAAGRGRQMNKGAEAASADWLLFLHADSSLTSSRQLTDSLACITGYGVDFAGHFSLEFETDNPEVRQALVFFEAKTRLNRPGTFNGDQGLIIHTDRFRLLGGFSTTHTFLEDQDLGQRFIETGTFITLPFSLKTSARRFEEEGIQARIILNAIIMGMFTLEHDSFFQSAPGVYRVASEGRRLDLRPFFKLTRSSLFDRGWLIGLTRCFSIGRYVAANTWQLALLRGLKTGDITESLRRYDHIYAPVCQSAIGTLAGTLSVVVWFFFLELKLRFYSPALSGESQR